MVRETRHLWVGNLPENIREERIREHFKRYGRVQSVKLLPRCTEEKTGEITMACTVAFMDIKSASKAHNAELKIDDRTLNTEYYEPAAIPSATASPQNTPSPYSTSPGSTRFPNGHGSTDDHGTIPFTDRFYDRTTSSSRLAGSSGGGTGTSGVGGSDSAEFLGSGRGTTRGSSTTTSTSASTTYHGDAVSAGGGRSSSSSSSSAAPAATTTGRSRERTGAYRNGPYGSNTTANATSLDGRHTSRIPTTPNSWGYESARYNSTGNNQSDTGYSTTTPTENIERRTSDQIPKKKAKSKAGSQAGSRSPSPTGSTSSRSPSRSRSRSSSSSTSSSMSRDTSSTSSPKSKRLTSSNTLNSNHQPVVHSDDRRPLAICVKNLPVRSSDTSLKDGLFHEYKKHGKVTWVKVVGKDAERHAIVCFKKPEDVEKALEVSYDKLFFGCKIEVAPYQGYDVEDNDLRPYEAEIDEYHPKATRTLFIGNLEKDVTASDLRKHFDQFGEIIEIDIKKQGAVSSYAFCQYSDIVSVVKAIRKMDGEHLGSNRIKLGFGKSMPYNCVWIDGINENVNDKYLKMQFEPFGVISKLHIDREKGQALIFYDQVMSAQTAVAKMRGFTLKNTKIQVDFASRECQESFFERLEKQGTILDRTVFEERREPIARTFEATPARFARYETPTRPRTSSYSSRSNASVSQVTSLQSPGTPGSVTPRGTSSRSRARFADYYDQTLDYADRHFRSYDEYSQSSTASHEDLYDHEYGFIHEAGDPLQVMDNVVPFAPPDMRNLQKERVHLLEQLEECPSSGDELISPKKRMKIDLLDTVITSDVIIEANRDHRKVMEVRRLSDVNLKHHSRRPSIDSGKHLRHEVIYVPRSVCKRRKTGGSDSGSRVQQFDHSGSESVGGSRPGTPLCDERPENCQPSEPRRVPREREGPLTLPLPRFAAQIMNKGSISIAGIKGQKDNILSSPPPAVTSPRISNPRPPSPVHVPPPASPPPRPPSLSSNSSDGDITPPSPSLEERIKSLDERYEKWSGSRAISAAGGDALALLDANLEKFRQRHKILDLDLKEVQPSEIVKSVMAKRSVFDEDLKRLENVGEKYEPKEFSFFPRSTLTTQTTVPTMPLSTPPVLKLSTVPAIPKTPTLLSPRSAGTGMPAAKGLQYPFPTHPPILMSPSVVSTHQQTPTTSTTTVTSQLPLQTATTTTPTSLSASVLITATTTMPSATTAPPRGASHGDNRLKPCSSAPSDTRTSSKMIVNKTNVVSAVKISEKTNVNIPNASDGKFVRDKSGDKISCRRDSGSSSNSPRSDIKTRRNSDTSARRSDDSDAEQAHKERAQSEERKRERMEKIKVENEKLEKEKSERERLERERHEHEKQEKLRLEKERLEKERLERESELEKQRLEKERLEKERLEKEKLEKEQQEQQRLKLERERIEKENLEKIQREKEKQEHERLERERLEKERKEKEEIERRLREEQEKQRLEKEKHEKEKKEREELERTERRYREEKERRNEDSEKDNKHDREREKVRHKDDNHDKRKDDHRHHHSDNKHKENHLDKLIEHKHTKDSSSKDDKLASKDSNQISTHDSRSSYDKNKVHLDRDSDRRKESIKENRDNNIHEKHKHISDNRIRDIVETRHMSIDLDKVKSSHEKHDPSKRKERNNSLPASIGSKRRFSSQETVDMCEDSKKIKLSHDSKKISERRDSKDSTRSEDRMKTSKHKNNIHKSHDKFNSSKDSEEKRKEREERHKKHKLDKQKSKSKSREKESHDSSTVTLPDKEFLTKLELKSNEDKDKHKLKESKEKQEKRTTTEEHERIKKLSIEKSTERPQLPHEKIPKIPLDSESSMRSIEEKKKRDRIRKLVNSSDSDSDEPKKHSIFDIVDDEPAYISMYDKVKARSCKNMAKLEEEKRQEKVKAKFNQLKQSRAKREEKKRSTSWDEDSDSDKEHCEIRIKRCPKVLDSSDDDGQERRPRKIYSDSDSSTIFKNVKHELIDTSDDESRNKTIILKSIKSRITSDTSEDEQNKPKIELHIKQEFPETTTTTTTTEIQSYNMEIPDDKSHLFKVKDEINKVKKERRNSKHQDTEIPNSTFSDTSQSEIKLEKFNTKHFVDITTDEELHEVSKKERSERREKKHKKKQKKQKHSISSEESGKFENISDCTHSENQEKPKHDKKKEHSKKEKRRDKNREGRDKSKKSRKNKLDNKSDSKRDGKMENIFGSLSEDSENGTKELDQEPKFEEEPAVVVNPPVYNSESEKEHENKTKDKLEREREKEEHKRKKEKKRRDKERRLQEVAAAAASLAVANEQGSNDNSMDYIDMGKQLEANMMMQDDDLNLNKTTESNFETTDDTFNFETIESKKEKEEKRENKEKKKKRKKSKDEKNKHHNHHHHHHHHDKNKIKSPENKTETPRIESSSEPIISTPTQPQNPSLPSILDEQSPVNSKTLTPEYSPINPIISPIPKTPTTQDKKRDKLIPGFGSEIDDKLHESAVKSISEFQAPVNKEEQPTAGTEEADNKPAQGPEEKPRAVISQEETEDAVAALLGESFGSGKQEEFYNDNNSIEEPTNSLVENANVQDDEEMRQAVQSLSAADLDIKPDTPQSEHDLQIDTDTEEQEDVPVRFDSAPKTPEIVEFPQLPKTPDLPPFFANSIDEKQTALKSTPNISSPPSLTPIRSSPSNVEARKSVDVEKPLPTEQQQQQRTVISNSWNADKKLDVPISKPQPTVIKIESKMVTTSVSESSMQITTVASKPFTSPPVLKIAEPQYPPLKPLSKPDLSPVTDLSKIQTVPVVQTPTKSSTPPQLHNLPARSPIQMNKPPIDTGLLSPRLPPGLIHNRMPITSVMVSKPMQATTVILQQSKVATTIEPPKLVSTSEPRSQERPRMIFQSSSIQPPQFTNFNSNQPRMIQGNIRHLPPPGLLVPARQFNYLAGVPHPTFNVSSNLHETNTENLPDAHAKIPHGLPPHLNTTHTPLTHLSIPKEIIGNKPPTPTLVSPKSTTDSPNSGQFSPMCGSPQVKNSPSPEPTLATMSPKSMPIGSPKPTSEINQQFLLQSTTKNTEPPRVPTPKSEQRMIFQPSNMQSPHYGNFNMNPSRIMMQGNIRHLPSSGLLVPARHPFNYLPHSTYNIHENSTENVSDSQSKISQPTTQSTSMLPSPKASTNSSITNPFSSASISPQFKNSSSPIQTQVVMSPKPIENPKLIPTESPAATTESTVNVPEQSVPTSEMNSSISIHSPVIVSTTSTSEPQKNEPVIKEQEKPIKLAIEAVTDELNLSLGKPSPEIPPEVKSEPTEIKSEIKDEPKVESQPDHQDPINKDNIEEKIPTVVVEKDITTDVKEIEKFDEEKTETESIVSDISKERSISADILAKDDPLDTKEDSDYWSAKEVNIDSVIKTLCSADELSDHSSENGKTEWFDDHKSDVPKLQTTNPTVFNKSLSPLKKQEETPDSNEPRSDESELLNDSIEPESTEDETKEPPILRSSSRRGGRGRGRGKNQPVRGAISTTGGIQTRRGKLKEQSQPNPPVAKRGRGAKTRNERKSSKTEFESAPADIYEFRDEPDDSNKEQRPRLILTIKSPAVLSSNNAQTTATVKEVTKDGAKEIGKEQPKETHCAVISKTPEHKSDEFASPSTNTRKSRRLLERDTSKNTVDDTIEDVIKNTVQAKGLANQRRSGRQANPKQSPPQPETPRKSPRGRKGRRGSEAAETSSSEETLKEEIKVISPLQIKSIEKPKELEKQKDTEHPIEKTPEPVLKEKPIEGLKATVLRRIKGEMNLQNSNEPTNLIDPVTGELIPMRESEEGKYIPLPGTNNVALHKKPEELPNKELPLAPNANEPEQSKLLEVVKTQPSVIAQPQQITVVQQPKPHTLKAHVLSSQAAQAVTQQVSVPQTKVTTSTVVVSSKSTSEEIVVPKQTPPIVITKSITPIVVSKSVTPVVVTKPVTPVVVSKPVTPVVVSKPVTPISQHLTVNTNLGVSSPHLSPRANLSMNVSTKPMPKQLVKTPALSPGLIASQQKQQVQQMLATKQPQVPKPHITPSIVSQAQIMNTQLAHMKHQPMIKQQVQQVILGKAPIVKQLPPQQILSGAIPSPPLSKSQSTLNNPARIIQPASSAGGKGIMDPPKVDVTMNNVMLGQRPKLSPQGPQQRIVGQTGLPLPGYEPSLHGERSLLNRSRSPPPAHQNSPSPKGEAIAHFPPGQLRPPPDLNPHYMHPSHMIQYQQYLRQQQLQHFSRTGCIEKLGDGQEGEEAPVTSPPLELRRSRGTGVPHSLHSPHDRTTDSPQIGQVYNVHSTARIPYHHPSRYYDQAEPPPAHRPLTSHGSLAALGSDRGLAHIGTPDRPLSGHSALSAHMGGLGPADRPLSTHIDRPLSAHGFMGAGLGAAGNLMGAVARHIGADAPTTQRGLQAATPPHASQVPPQAESLLMLLKQYPCMWQGLLALKNDQAAVQMYFVSGNDAVAKCSLPKNTDGSTPPLRIFQRMRLEPPQVEGVARKMQMENEHCMLLALPCGHDHMDVLKQSTNLTSGFITYLQQKQAAGIVNVAAPGTTQPAAYVVHIFPSCDFVNENLRRIAPSLLERVADIAHLLIVITTV